MLLASLALLACQPAPAERPATGCDATRPREGEVVVERVACEERLFASTEGRGSDLWVANAWTRAVVRHPAEALTVPGVGGGTVIDASGWSSRDALHEVVPLVDGGWLDVAEWSLAPDHLEVRGEVRSLPDTPAASPGAQRVVRWVPDPWSPWLCAEGADGLWIHAAGEHELLDGRLVGERLVYAHDGTGALDLGGALRADGVCLLASPTSEAWGWLAPSGRGLAGIAPEADEVTLLRAGERVGRVRVDQEGAFSTRVPDDVDAVRAEADGRAPGPEVAVGEALELEVGDPGTVQLVLAWEGGPPRPVRVDWSDARGRGGTAVLPGGGGDLALGAGAYDLALGAGPAVEPLAVRVEVPGGSEVQLGAALRWIFDPGEYVLVDLAVPGDRSRTWRGTDARALREAASSGVAFAVLAPEDDAAAGEIDEAWSGAIRWRDGALHTSHQGWRIVSWPWAATARHGGHGVPAMGDLGPTDGLSVAWGGEGKGRITAVDPAWLDAVEEPPWRVWPRPDLVRLDSPWELDGWLHWLDAGVALAPTGPLTWVEVADPGRLATADAEDALTRGRTCATTGPLVRLEVDGLRPGDTRDDLGVGRELPVVVEVLAAPGDLDALVLLGAGGRVLQRWEDPPGRPLEARIWSTEPWIAAAAWSEDGSSWAVTGPVWLSPPG